MYSLLAAALLPVILLMFYIYKRDTFQKEPWPLLLKAFGFGVLAAFIDIPVAHLTQSIVPKLFSSPGWDAFHMAFFGAAFPEDAVQCPGTHRPWKRTRLPG